MKGISDYLEKFKNIKDPRRDKEVIASAIKKITTFPIDTADISIQRSVVFLNTNPYMLHEVRSKKEALLEEIGKSLKGITDIK